jgi:RNA polymerase sigma-70 factor (ECF subfamily)
MTPDHDPKAQLISLLPRLRRFAQGLTHDRHQADDLVQAACLKALERWHQFEPGSNLAAWLFRIVQTTWLDEYRSRQRHATDAVGDELPELPGEDGRELLERRSEGRRVQAVMQTLPEEQRTVLMMVAVDGLSYRDASQALGVPVGTVMSRLSRARLRMLEALAV